jgi:aminomethyltransferase
MNTTFLRTPLFDWHVARGGRMVEFGGWEMPVQYTSIVAEHHAVRRAAGLFDISHMGRLRFSGPDSAAFLNHLVTNDVTRLAVGQIQYALVANEQGGTLDDVLVYRFADHHLLVVNASNREKIVRWIEQHRGAFRIEMEDLTTAQAMVALQGPQAESLLQPLVDVRLSEIKYFFASPGKILGHDGLISRTGYTGEDGFEIIVVAQHATELAEKLVAGAMPCGLGCRDTLRLEAAMPLYGHELSEEIDPFTAGLGFAVKLDKPDFIGKSALVAAKANANRPRRVGLRLDGKRIAREGALLFVGDRQVGRVTSGTFSPTLEAPIAMAYVEAAQATIGTMLDVDFRGQRLPARVVSLPFYRGEMPAKHAK